MKFFPKSLIYNAKKIAKFPREIMKDDKNDIKRALYWSENREQPAHNTIRKTARECISKQYEWSEEHESLGGGNFLRKNIINDES